MSGKHALVVHDFEQPVSVVGYNKAQGMLAVNTKTVTAALAYDDPSTGEVIIIVVHQAVLIPHLEVNLMCPMQVRVNDVKLDEVPKFLTGNPHLTTTRLILLNKKLLYPNDVMKVG